MIRRSSPHAHGGPPMSTPKRIQRQRTAGWRMPEGAIYVGRPGVWGNPFWHAQRFYGVENAIVLYRDLFTGWNPSHSAHHNKPVLSYADHREWLRRFKGHPAEVARAVLRGQDLACWCKLDQLCHADVLLEIANR